MTFEEWMAFLNSPIVLAILLPLLAALIKKIWQARPEWEKIYDEHRGQIWDAIRHAEQAISSKETHRATKRADEALRFLIQIHELSQKDRGALRKAIEKTLEKKKEME